MPQQSYAETIATWQRDPQAFWAEAAKGLDWTRPWDRVFDPAMGPYGQWFPGGELNTCANALDRHVAAGRGAQAALIWDSAMTGVVETFTYEQLRDRTAKVAGALRALAGNRHQARWDVAGVHKQLGLFAGLPSPDEAVVALPAPTHNAFSAE